jgi:hypothetical protein
MTRLRPQARPAWSAVVVALAACLVLAARPTSAIGQDLSGRQVVLFGVLATPGSNAMDPKISPVVAAQLRRTLPGHGFKLIQIKSSRVATGQSVVLDLGDGFTTSALLANPLDPNGKVQMRFALSIHGLPQFQSIVVTPVDQFNFFDKVLSNNSHLLIGVGAR